MSTLIPQPPRVPIATTSDGKPAFITREWLQFLAVALMERVGGIDAPSNVDLAQSDDDDSGLEEFKAEFAKALEGLAQTPPVVDWVSAEDASPPSMAEVRIEQLENETAQLREQLAVAMTEIAGLKQGLTA